MPTKVLFVCLGNICRSPAAAAVFRSLVAKEGLHEAIVVDSAGTSDWFKGEPADPRAQQEARRRGVSLAKHRSRPVVPQDFHDFDYILAMDEANLEWLLDACPESMSHKIQRCVDYVPQMNIDAVPDPYYDGPEGFRRVFDILESSAQALLAHIRQDREL